MNVRQTEFPGLLVITPKVYSDERGYFFESFNQQRFKEQTGLEVSFVQDNESMSVKDTLRGLHFQVPPHTQAKLVRVQKGAVLDVVVDLRVGSPTFGKSFSIQLDSVVRTQLYIPEGFAHGFLTLEDNTVFSYKCSNLYHPDSERTLAWNDQELQIDWRIANPIVSAKDSEGLAFSELDSPFTLE